MSSIVMTSAPATTPVSLTELKEKLRITTTDEDTTLTMYLEAAVDYCQEYQWAQYITATYVERFDSFPCEFRPQRSPLIAVSTLQYVDTAGNTQTLTANTDYVVDAYSKPGRIVPAFTSSGWPATRGFINDVVLTYTAGYGASGSSVPDEIRQAILLKAMQQRGDCDSSIELLDRAIHSLLDKRSFRVFY